MGFGCMGTHLEDPDRLMGGSVFSPIMVNEDPEERKSHLTKEALDHLHKLGLSFGELVEYVFNPQNKLGLPE